MLELPLPSLPLNHIVSILCPLVTVRPPYARLPQPSHYHEVGHGHGRRGRDFRRREGVESRVEPVLDDLADELRRQEVRELRRQRLGEGGQVGACVVLEATGLKNPAEVRVFAEWPLR